MRVLVFGGTSEGNELAFGLARAGIDVLVSVATEAGVRALPADMPHLSVRQGALDTPAMLELFGGFDLVADATHPYARDISRHVREVVEQAGKPLMRIVRPASDTAGCTLVGSLDEAVAAIAGDPGLEGGSVLSTTGSKEVARYAALPGYRERLFARVLDDGASIEACRAIGLPDSNILAGRGPFSLEDNLRDIDAHAIAALVTKDSGAAGGFPEKVEAARMRGVRVIVIRRPEEEEGLTVDEALETILAFDQGDGVSVQFLNT